MAVSTLRQKKPTSTNHLNLDIAFLGRLQDAVKIGKYYAEYRRLNQDEEKSLISYEFFFNSDIYLAINEAGDWWCENRDVFRAIEMVPIEMLPYFKFVFDCRKDPVHDKNSEPTPEEVSARQTALSRFIARHRRSLGLIEGDPCSTFMMALLESDKQIFYLTYFDGKWLLEIWTEHTLPDTETSPTYHSFVVPDDVVEVLIETFPGRHHSFTSYF